MSHPNYEHGIHITTVDQAEKECSKFVTSYVSYENLPGYLQNLDILVDKISDLNLPLTNHIKGAFVMILKMCTDVLEPRKKALKANVASLRNNYAKATIGLNKKAVASEKPLLHAEIKTLDSSINMYNEIKKKLIALFGKTTTAAAGGGGSAPRRSTRANHRNHRKQRKQRMTRRH